jgi:hypothetical protein
MTSTLHTPDDIHAKKYDTCSIDRGTTLTSFRSTVNTKTLVAVVQKAQQIRRISAHLMMAQ